MKITHVDHVAIAVRSLEEATKLFLGVLGGEFITGGDDERLDIRTLQLRLTDMKVELMEPLSESSYLRAYLDRHGQGFHHMTIFVDDVEQAIRELEAGGYEVVDTNLEHPAWRETYLRPKSGFGTLLQIADTDQSWDMPFEGVTLEAVLAGDAVWHDRGPLLRSSGRNDP